MLRNAIAPRPAVLGLALAVATMGLGGQPAVRPDPTTTEANITRVTTNLLEDSQFAHHPFDHELARTLLGRYLDSLDGARTLFLQSDVDEFAAYGATLAQATRGTGDTSVARAIFGRYLQRLQERVSYDTDRLRTETFDFTGHDVYSFDREHAQRPRDLTEARALWGQELRAEYLQEKLGDKPPAKVAQTLTQRYAQQLKTMKALRSDEVLDIYLDALAHVYDPHSDYLGHEQMENLSIAMKLSLFGIGATLENADGYCKIRELVPGGPAARSGLLKPGDRIVAVGQPGQEPADIVNMPLSHAVELIRGAKGSTVTLMVLAADAADGSVPRKASIVRDRVKLEDQEAKASVLDLPTGDGAPLRLGVIELPSFYADMGASDGSAPRSATADVSRLLRKLEVEHVRGIVLDLRNNGGGSLVEAISLTGLFIRTGPVVQTRDRSGAIEGGAVDDPSVLYDGPLVLLTSRLSAAGAGFLAGAVQESGRALVVGDTSTFGKGTVQNVLPLGRVMDQVRLPYAYDPGALKITTSKFYRPSGASTQLRGVASDIVLPSPTDFSDVNESALEDPLPWDTVPSARYEPVGRVAPYVDVLRADSARRVASEKGFAYLAGDIARLKKVRATKSLSLNEAERRQELAELRARDHQREQEDRDGLISGPTLYPITLENASSPGLPPPAAKKQGRVHGADTPTMPDDRSEATARHSPADDVILDESVRILADYVDRIGGASASVRARDARLRPVARSR